MSRDLTHLFNPRSVAIIGASEHPEKVGAIILKNIILSGYQGKIYPVNPNVSELGGLKFYPDINSLPEIPDLALVAIPAARVNSVLEDIGQKGIKNVVVYSAGYRETGPDGAALEKELLEIAQKYDLKILGPNCLGFVNNNSSLNATFGPPVSVAGPLRLITQSGAIASSLLDWSRTVGLGFSDFISIGNKSVVTENDILSGYISLPIEPLSPIGLYLESIANGPEFVRIARQITPRHPIFILKPGKSSSAIKAMQSHTGAMAGEDAVLDAALSDSGIIRCHELGEFFDLARAFSWENVPDGPGVAVISNAGGPGVLSADAVTASGLEMAAFDETTNQKLLEALPRMASIINPVDVLGDALPERYGRALEIVLSEPSVNSVVCIITPQLMTRIAETAEIIGRLSQKFSQPIFCSFIGGDSTTGGEAILNKFKIPSFDYPETAIKTLARMWQWQQYRRSLSSQLPSPEVPLKNPSAVKNIFTAVAADHRHSLNNIESDDLIRAAGIRSPDTATVATIEDADNFGHRVGWPIVLKLSAPTLIHKADVGGIFLNLNSRQDIADAWGKIGLKIDELKESVPSLKIQAQKQINSGVEIIVGVKRDPTFGPVLLFGAGGALAELIGDRQLRLLPVGLTALKKLIGRSRIFPLLNGFRGGPVFSLEPLYDTIYKLCHLALDFPQISEIEINPLKVTQNGVYALDIKTILMDTSPPSAASSPSPFKTAVLLSHEQLTAKMHHYLFESDAPLQFKAGQYINIRINDKKLNAYSIARMEGDRRFELLIDVSPCGQGCRYFQSLVPGNSIKFMGPFGIFTLRPHIGVDHLIFMGTGSGISPLFSQVESLYSDPSFNLPVTFYFGVRNQSEIFWEKRLRQFEDTHPNFRLVISLSQPETGWTGDIGHITDCVKSDFPDASRVAAYICGNRPMMDEAIYSLTHAGCPRDRIYHEKFF